MRAQVVGRLQAAQPGQLVGLVELLARRAGHVDVERLRLVDPLLAPRRRLDQPLRLDLEGGRVELPSGPRARGRSGCSEPSKCFRSMTITSSHRPARFRSRTRYSLTIVNSPDRFDLTDRLPNDGSIEALTPMMFEIVAVGAIATQFELRMPCSPMRGAQRVPVERRAAVDLDQRSDVGRFRLPRCSASRSSVSIGRMPRSHSEPR